jgi:drug/metabolite transporter (DMT)-like permease
MPDHHPLRGIALMMLAIICFAGHDAMVKHLATQVPVLIIVWFRYTVHFVLMLVLLGPTVGRGLVRTRRPWALTLRGLTLIITTVLGATAFRTMPLAETTAVIFLSPLIVSLAAGPVLGEKTGSAQWLAAAVGFCGVLLIARPGSGIVGSGLFFAIGAAVFLSLYQLQTRQLARSEGAYPLLFFTALAGAASMSIGAPFYWSSFSLDWVNGGMLLSLGLIAGLGHLLMTEAFRHAPASTLSSMLYLQLAWATLLGWLVFAHWPDGYAFAGMAIIAASSGGLVWFEHRRHAALKERIKSS